MEVEEEKLDINEEELEAEHETEGVNFEALAALSRSANDSKQKKVNLQDDIVCWWNND